MFLRSEGLRGGPGSKRGQSTPPEVPRDTPESENAKNTKVKQQLLLNRNMNAMYKTICFETLTAPVLELLNLNNCFWGDIEFDVCFTIVDRCCDASKSESYDSIAVFDNRKLKKGGRGDESGCFT